MVAVIPEYQEDKLFSITEAARRQRVTRQAVYVAIKLGKLEAMKSGSRWEIQEDALKQYTKGKYSRKRSKLNGELIFDPAKEELSIYDAAKLLRVPQQKIYYAVRVNKVKYVRKGSAYVIKMQDLMAYKEKHLKRKKNLMSFY